MTQQTSLLDPDPPSPIALDVADLVHRYGYAPVASELQMHVPLRAVPSAPARDTDPDTSHEAGPRERDLSRFSDRSRQAKLLRAFVVGPRTDHSATARVIGTSAAPAAWDGCRRRCSDLRAAGFLMDSGLRQRNPASPDVSIVWKLTLAGERAVESLDTTGWSR